MGEGRGTTLPLSSGEGGREKDGASEHVNKLFSSLPRSPLLLCAFPQLLSPLFFRRWDQEESGGIPTDEAPPLSLCVAPGLKCHQRGEGGREKVEMLEIVWEK